MDDLAGIDFSTSSKQPEKTPKATPLHDYASLKPATGSATSSRSTPLLATKQHGSTPSLRTRPAATTAHADSFSGLVALNATKKADTLSLQERQDKLFEERKRRQAEQQRVFDSQFGSSKAFTADLQEPNRNESSLKWAPNVNTIGTVPVKASSHHAVSTRGHYPPEPIVSRKNDDDILSAFNAATPVDRSSHLPTPEPELRTLAPRANKSSNYKSLESREQDQNLELGIVDDDPFNLHTLATASKRKSDKASDDEKSDDILGALGKPVSETKFNLTQAQREGSDDDGIKGKPSRTKMQDKAISEIVDMGFSITQAKDALRHTSNGYNVESAVNYLLSKAHEDSRLKAQNNGKTKNSKNDDRNMDQMLQAAKTGNLDAAQYASQVGNNLMKSANFLWKSGQKKVQRAVSDLQQEPDTSQPKWMRESSSRIKTETFQESESRRAGFGNPAVRGNADSRKDGSFTDEALMLESNGAKSSITAFNKDKTSKSSTAAANSLTRNKTDTSHHHLNHPNTRVTRPSTQQNVQSSLPIAKPSRELVEQESANAYISPARRKGRINQSPKTMPQQDAQFRKMSQAQAQASGSLRPGQHGVKSTAQNMGKAVATPIHLKPKTRSIPQVSEEALSSSLSHRQEGSDAYKRGDHNAAYEFYSRAMIPLPGSHPARIVILCNRALTSIKMGDPKAAIADADAALEIIGPAKGTGETVSLSRTEGSRDMKEFYGKALLRKAEALESMERWDDAFVIWQEAIQTGVGGSISIQGRDRCEKARKPPVPTASKPKSSGGRPVSRPKASALRDLSGESGGMDSQAVQKLRAANAAEKRSDDEKFALADHVDSRLAGWKGSKSDNLRALLGSLDKVLWPEAGWTPVGMSDLVMANKVKIIYMKAIAKVHPDKVGLDISQDIIQNLIS